MGRTCDSLRAMIEHYTKSAGYLGWSSKSALSAVAPAPGSFTVEVQIMVTVLFFSVTVLVFGYSISFDSLKNVVFPIF